jgi:anti-anti-sigma factor
VAPFVPDCELEIMSEVITRDKGDVLIVGFGVQTIIADAVIEKIGSELLRVVDRAQGKILLDFRGVKHMSSSMIGKVLLLRKNCATAKITLKLCNIDSELKEVFVSTGLNKVLSIYDTESRALAAFKKKRWFW